MHSHSYRTCRVHSVSSFRRDVSVHRSCRDTSLPHQVNRCRSTCIPLIDSLHTQHIPIQLQSASAFLSILRTPLHRTTSHRPQGGLRPRREAEPGFVVPSLCRTHDTAQRSPHICPKRNFSHELCVLAEHFAALVPLDSPSRTLPPRPGSSLLGVSEKDAGPQSARTIMRGKSEA